MGVPYAEAGFDLEYFRWVGGWVCGVCGGLMLFVGRGDPKPFYTMIRGLFAREARVPSPTRAHWFLRLLWEK